MAWDWNKVWKFLEEYSLEGFVTLVIIAVLSWLARKLRPHIKRWLFTISELRKEISSLQNEVSALQTHIDCALHAVARVETDNHGHEGQSLWLQTPIRQPHNYFRFTRGQCIPIWIFANLKGGVAKSTNATNLAAHYANKGETVLLIDLDYQASATAMALRDNQRSIPGHDCRATQLVDGQFTPQMLFDPSTTPTVDKDGMVRTEALSVIPSAWDLANAENRLMVQWLLSAREEDIRYTLALLLHDASVQHHFNPYYNRCTATPYDGLRPGSMCRYRCDHPYRAG